MPDIGRRLAVWRPPISYLPRVLLEPQRPLLALLVAWPIAFFPTLALGAVVSVIVPKSAFPFFPSANWNLFWLIVVAAPLVETLIMAAALMLLRLFLSPTAAVLVSAAGWGIAHSSAAPAWGLVIWWPFLIFSTLFLTWRSRSTILAIGMVAAAHGAHNLLPALLLVLGLEG